jgi:hypothetical protein
MMRPLENESLLKDLLLDPPLYAGILLGVLGGLWAINAITWTTVRTNGHLVRHLLRYVLAQESGVALGMAGAALGLLAVTLAVLTLMGTVLEGWASKLVVGGPDGTASRRRFDGFFRPFRIVATVSAAATVSAFGAAMDSASTHPVVQAILFGLAIWLLIWAIAGAVQLVHNFVRYARIVYKVPPKGDRSVLAAQAVIPRQAGVDGTESA